MSSCVRRRLNSLFDFVYFEVADFGPERWMSDLDTIHNRDQVVSMPALQQTPQGAHPPLKGPHALISQNPVSQALVLHGRNPTNTMSAKILSFHIRQQK